MRKYAAYPVAILLTACGDASLQGTFEKQMKSDGMDGYEIIHVEEGTSEGLVLYTSWTHEYPDNRNRPAINYYHNQDGRWTGMPGTECSDRGIARLGLAGGEFLFCSVLKEDWEYPVIRVGGNEARLFEFGDGLHVWFAVTGDRESKVTGVRDDGVEVPLD